MPERGLYIGPALISAIKTIFIGDIDRRRISGREEAAGEWMPRHAKKLEDDDGEAEIVVVRRSSYAGVACKGLHFGWLVGANADLAEPCAGTF